MKIIPFLTASFLLISFQVAHAIGYTCENKDPKATKTQVVFDYTNKKITVNGKEHKILGASGTRYGTGYMTAPQDPKKNNFYVFLAEEKQPNVVTFVLMDSEKGSTTLLNCKEFK